MKIFLYLVGGIIVSFIAIHLWIWIVDTFFKGVKSLIPWKKKNTQVWHTLNEDTIKEINKDTKVKDVHIYENID